MHHESENSFTIDEFCKSINQIINNNAEESGTISSNLTDFVLIFDQNMTSFLGSDDNISSYVESICSAMPMKLVKTKSDLIKYNLIKFVYPALLLFGIVGNLISLLVMVRIYYRGKNFKRFALSLAALSIADLGILVFACFMEYLEDFLQVDVKSSHLIVCKLFFFVCYLFSSFSAFLHAFIAAERWMVVAVPLKSKSTCTFRFNQLMILLIFIICGLFNMPLLWFATINEKIVLEKGSTFGIQITKECEIPEISAEFQMIFILIDSLFYCLIPFVITSAFSFLTLIKLTRTTTRFDEPFESRKSIKFNRRSNTTGSSFRSNITEMRNGSGNDDSNRLYKSQQKSNTSNFKITVMLMSIPISYLILSFPIAVIIIQGWFIKLSKTENRNSLYTITYCIGKILMYTNTSTNIFCYILFGKGLRKDFIAIFPCKLWSLKQKRRQKREALRRIFRPKQANISNEEIRLKNLPLYS